MCLHALRRDCNAEQTSISAGTQLYSHGWQGRQAAPSAYIQTGILQLLVSGKWVRSLPDSANDRNAGKASIFQVPDSCCRHACWALPLELDQYGK